MDEQKRSKILSGRKAVDAYRLAHSQLYLTGWHKGIPEEHTPMLNASLAELKKHGFISLQEFGDASQEMNIKELGSASKSEFLKRTKPVDYERLMLKWQ